MLVSPYVPFLLIDFPFGLIEVLLFYLHLFVIYFLMDVIFSMSIICKCCMAKNLQNVRKPQTTCLDDVCQKLSPSSSSSSSDAIRVSS